MTGSKGRATQRVRDAMLTDPRVLPGTASAKDAAQLLVRPEVRAVLVCEDDRLLGVVTSTRLVERVVAAGRDPAATPLADIVDGDVVTVDADAPLEEAYGVLEDRDLERVPVVAGGRLVGVLSRSALMRRLAEDEPPEADLEQPA